MQSANETRIKEFFLLGFPGLLPKYYGPVSALLFLVYLVITVGNLFILAVVICERSLQKPSYYIFCHLALTDLLFGNVTLPKAISKYWSNDSVISFYSCLIQMFFVHLIGAAHSFILMVMALDRFIAICSPLRYNSLFGNKTVSVLCGISWLVPTLFKVINVLEILRVPFCNSNIIVQCYCDHMSILNLGCEHVQEVRIIALVLAMISLLFPLGFIILSYFIIIAVVWRISSIRGCIKTLSTCAPQLIITCLFYLPRCFYYFANFLGFSFSVPIQVVIVMLYSHIPAAVNPVIYCLQTTDIKEILKKRFSSWKISRSTKPV